MQRKPPDETISSIDTIAEPSIHTAPHPSAPYVSVPDQSPSWLRSRTPARVALRRTGISLATSEVLDFQLAHARARDAVHAPLQSATLLPALQQILSEDTPSPIQLHSQAANRQTYLQRPDLGRILDASSLQTLATSGKTRAASPDLTIILADGLSALAVERHAIPLLAHLLPTLSKAESALRLAPICIVQQARVAIGDEIAHTLGAQLALVLIGERPGLSSPDSLGAYITWNPSPGITTDASRNCISNIRAEGLSYSQAAARLAYYIREARSRQTTGIALKDPEPGQLPQLAAPSSQKFASQQPAESSGEPA